MRRLRSEQLRFKRFDPPWRVIFHECESTLNFYVKVRNCETPEEVIHMLETLDEHIANAPNIASIETIRAMHEWLIVAVLSVD